ILFDIGLIGLCIAGIVAVLVTLWLRSGVFSWLDMVIMFNLQLFVVKMTFKIWSMSIQITTSIKKTCSACESALRARLCAALSHWRREGHAISETTDVNYERLRNLNIITNAVAASLQMCGAIPLSILSLTNGRTDARLRRGIFLVCFYYVL
ncbi:hypothetical protein GQ44DRAFT_628303, partial [Phaeosphaeriaceae sp. PMI808]